MATIYGLDFPENATANSDVRLEWSGSAYLQRQEHTTIWKYRPVQQTGYYAVVWHARSDDTWGASQYEFGTHGHPASDGVVDGSGQRQNGTGSSGTVHYWEIAGLLGSDFFCSPGGAGGTLIVKDVWYWQARQTEIVNVSGTDYVRHRFWPDIENSPSLVIEQDYALSGLGSPPSMKFVIGGSPWRKDQPSSGRNDEMPNGVVRHILLYDAVLSLSEIEDKLALTADDTTDPDIWYSNINPTPSDVTDKSGQGHDPSWANSNRPALFTDTVPDPYEPAFQGNAFQFGQYLASAASGINGTLDTSFANFTVSATGKVEIRGTGANNAIANVTASGLGKVEIEGVGANNTIANVTAAGLGTVLVQGTGANNTIAAVTATATGTVLVQGTGANNTIGEFTLAGIGSIGAAISGTLDKTIDAVTASATGTVLVQGTGANNTIGAVTASGTGKVEIQGTGANNTIAAVTAAGLGTVRIAGTGANNTIGAVTVSATGSVDIAGTLSSTIGPITVAAIGSVENRGTLDVTVGAVTLAGSGVIGNFISGQLNQSIGIFTVTATAGVQNTVRSMGATIKQGTFNGSVHAKPYSKSRFRQESMKWPSKG